MSPSADKWFVLNARDAIWRDAAGRSAVCDWEGDDEFGQVGVNLQVLAPGEVMSMYHQESDQEDFVVLAGEPVLIVEGEERALKPWDLVHCPPGTAHVIVGAGSAPAFVLAIGARAHQDGPDWGSYRVDATAGRHGASVERETAEPREAYARFTPREPTTYREGWLPD